MIDMALSPRIEEEPPIIDSGVAMSEINFFHEEEEIRRARSDVPIILESEKTTSDPIEESSVSSGASSNTEVPDKQPTRAIELTDPRIKNLLSVIPKKGHSLLLQLLESPRSSASLRQRAQSNLI